MLHQHGPEQDVCYNPLRDGAALVRKTARVITSPGVCIATVIGGQAKTPMYGVCYMRMKTYVLLRTLEMSIPIDMSFWQDLDEAGFVQDLQKKRKLRVRGQ